LLSKHSIESPHDLGVNPEESLVSRGRSAAFLIALVASSILLGEHQKVLAACRIHHVDVLFAPTDSRQQRLESDDGSEFMRPGNRE